MSNPTDVVKQIKNAARRKFSADDKICIVPEGLSPLEDGIGEVKSILLQLNY